MLEFFDESSDDSAIEEETLVFCRVCNANCSMEHLKDHVQDPVVPLERVAPKENSQNSIKDQEEAEQKVVSKDSSFQKKINDFLQDGGMEELNLQLSLEEDGDEETGSGSKDEEVFPEPTFKTESGVKLEAPPAANAHATSPPSSSEPSTPTSSAVRIKAEPRDDEQQNAAQGPPPLTNGLKLTVKTPAQLGLSGFAPPPDPPQPPPQPQPPQPPQPSDPTMHGIGPVQQLVQQIHRLPVPGQNSSPFPSPFGGGASPNQLPLLPGVQITSKPSLSRSSSVGSDGPPSKVPRVSPPDSPCPSVSITKSATPDVANLLATRGITVTPQGRGGGSISITPTRPPLSINSAVSITPAKGRVMKGGKQFGTIDLTSSPDPPRGGPARRMVGRTPSKACQVCDKVFHSAESFAVHMRTHTGGGARPAGHPPRFECSICTAQYPSAQSLATHKATYHPDAAGGPVPGGEMVIPVVDLRQGVTIQRLRQLGMTHCLPLSQLHSENGAPGMYGIPVLPLSSATNPAVANVGAFGATNLLPLGPMRPIQPP